MVFLMDVNVNSVLSSMYNNVVEEGLIESPVFHYSAGSQIN